MRILIVSESPLVQELGSPQINLSLAKALTVRGHEVRLWSPEALTERIQRPPSHAEKIEDLEHFAQDNGPFACIDTPPMTATPRLASHAPLVVRHSQPELLYWASALKAGLRRLSPRLLSAVVRGTQDAMRLRRSWERADIILCLGSYDLEWMRNRYPGWSEKFRRYFIALPATEREVFRALRRSRSGDLAGSPSFLWIGRWTAHKGIDRLLGFLRQRLSSKSGDRFTIAGCGAIGASAIQRALPNCDQVTIVPTYTRAELPALLARHHFGLFTSDTEGWGLSLNEMLEAGLPVYATPVGGVADLRPYFPFSLRAFPPPLEARAGTLEDLDANGYYERFSWGEIGRAYDADVLQSFV
jgi:glycosyltransferase involved in cell wall biosynthesis